MMEHHADFISGSTPLPVKRKTVFKQCPSCTHSWKSQQDFLSDMNLVIVGYQVNFKRLETGYFLFNHLTCKTTLSIFVDDFRNLHSGPVFRERKTESEECPGYCLKESELNPCPAECECAYVREIIQIIQDWKKK